VAVNSLQEIPARGPGRPFEKGRPGNPAAGPAAQHRAKHQAWQAAALAIREAQPSPAPHTWKSPALPIAVSARRPDYQSPISACEEIGTTPKKEGAEQAPCVVRDAPSALLTMRYVVDGFKKNPHPEEAAKRPSRRTHYADPAIRRFICRTVQKNKIGCPYVLQPNPKSLWPGSSRPSTPSSHSAAGAPRTASAARTALN
jgi:hypothetical protein